MKTPPQIVHILMAGRALCKLGPPSEWNTYEVWVEMKEHAKATCEECQRMYEVLKGRAPRS
jgi:hypothetical protein